MSFLKSKNPAIKAWLKFSLLTLLLVFSARSPAYTLGIFPYYEPLKLAVLHAPFVKALNNAEFSQIDQPVYFRTSDSFSIFHQRTKQLYFDFIMTAPNLGYRATVNKLYHPVLRFSYRPKAVFVVSEKSGIKDLESLKGKSIAFPPDLAIITRVSMKTLAEVGVAKESYNKKYLKSHYGSFLWLKSGKSDVSVLTEAVWLRLKPEEREGMYVIGYSESVPGIFVIAKEKNMVEPLRKTLMSFAKTSAGQSYFIQSNLKGFQPVTQEDIDFIARLYEDNK